MSTVAIYTDVTFDRIPLCSFLTSSRRWHLRSQLSCSSLRGHTSAEIILSRIAANKSDGLQREENKLCVRVAIYWRPIFSVTLIIGIIGINRIFRTIA